MPSKNTEESVRIILSRIIINDGHFDFIDGQIKEDVSLFNFSMGLFILFIYVI